MSTWDQGRLFELATMVEREAKTIDMLAARTAIVAAGCKPVHHTDTASLAAAVKHLEGAAQTLREALALGKPAPVLMAAE